MAEQVQVSFNGLFWYAQGHYLYDVIDSPTGHDASLRPNQLLAVSLPHSPLPAERARAVVEAVGQRLLTSYGLRSLSPDHPDYLDVYGGDQWARDGAYHQGTVWAWLMGPYVAACHRLGGDTAAARRLLEPFAHHLHNAGMGTVSEIFDGGEPHSPRGCPAQAWSVAELLRLWLALQKEEE
jgi:glycogen debranching enzyme